MRKHTNTVMAGLLGIAFLTGCTTWQKGDGDRSAGRVVDDKKITANIENKLEDEKVYKFKGVDVRTYQGVVQLSGFVTSEGQKQRAGLLAEETPGVARVVNSIVLKPQGGELTPTGRDNTGTRTYDSTTNQLNRVND